MDGTWIVEAVGHHLAIEKWMPGMGPSERSLPAWVRQFKEKWRSAPARDSEA
jgi:hypothetical protein